MGARCLLALALPTAFAGRPCVVSDWRFGFTECLVDDGGGRSRDAFAYVPNTTCDLQHAHSQPLPEPLLNLPCHEPCEAGTRLDIHLAQRQGGKNALQVECRPCGVGTFSLGGGLLADGRGGDWAKPWPPGLGTFCFYRGSDYRWHPGSTPASVCVLRLQTSQGESVAHTRAGTWNAKLPDTELDLPLVVAAGDRLACGDLKASEFNVTGRAVLVLRGICPFQRKAEALAKLGAKAVVIYNNIANAGYFIPAAVNESATPNIPIFMVTRETGEEWLKQEPLEGARLRAASTRCSSLEPTSVLGALSNNSAEALSRENWQSIEGHRLCSPWASDPSGRFIHSGNNLHYHWIFSVLTLGVNFVRDGHIRFRYSVDAERPYDGLSFAMDQADKMTVTSWKAPYEDFEVEVPRGPHTFTWVFTKDFGRSAGLDQARIQLLELTGTDYADTECRDCRAFSADRVGCGLCGHNSYLDTNSSGCKKCPEGLWAARGSVDVESCYHYRACTPDDVERSYYAFELVEGARRVIPGQDCRQNRALVRHSWRKPLRCDPNATGAASLPSETVTRCAPCQPHESRPNGGACKPTTLTCPVGSYAMREQKVSHWHSWPRNFSTELWGSEFASSGAWQRLANGTAAVVGAAFIGDSSALWSALSPELRVDVALLHLDVELDSAGNLSFIAEVRPVLAWGTLAKLSVNGSAGLGERVETDGPFVEVRLPLPPGLHRVTWSWHYDTEATDQGLDLVDADATGLKLLNVSVTHALGAGTAGCEHCRAGYEVAPGAASCRPCTPGKSSTLYAADGSERGRSATCQRCPAGRAASPGAASCYKCGPGLQSSSGQHHCRPMPVLGQALQWNVDALAQAWSEKVNGSLRTVRVEGHHYHLGLFALGARPDGVVGELAYWWERLPPLTGVRDGVCSKPLEELRLVANRLESLKPAAEEHEGIGFWAEFTGTCGQDDNRVRRSRIFFRCDALAASGNPLAVAAAGLSASSSWVPDVSFASGHRPTTLRGCEDLVLEWRTSLACPLCRRQDFVPVAESACQGDKGKHMRFVNKQPCMGGVQRPEGYWEPCTRKVGVIITVVAVFVGLILCCLGFYVLLLRRRYSKYMKLEEQGATAPPATIGAPTSAA